MKSADKRKEFVKSLHLDEEKKLINATHNEPDVPVEQIHENPFISSLQTPLF